MVCLFAKFQEWRDDRRGMRNLVSVHGRFLCDAETLQSVVILQTFICYNVHVTGGGGGGGGGGVVEAQEITRKQAYSYVFM